MNPLELMLHPVRLRIVHAMSDGRPRTTAELMERLPDVSKATMYRQVGVLADNEVLTVEREQRVHSVLERRYRLSQSSTVIAADLLATMTTDDHRRLFGVAMATLMAEFNAYLDRPDSDPVADRVSYLQATLWLSPEELSGFFDEVRAALRSRMDNAPSAERKPYLVSPVLFPVPGEPED